MELDLDGAKTARAASHRGRAGGSDEPMPKWEPTPQQPLPQPLFPSSQVTGGDASTQTSSYEVDMPRTSRPLTVFDTCPSESQRTRSAPIPPRFRQGLNPRSAGWHSTLSCPEQRPCMRCFRRHSRASCTPGVSFMQGARAVALIYASRLQDTQEKLAEMNNVQTVAYPSGQNLRERHGERHGPARGAVRVLHHLTSSSIVCQRLR